MRSREELDNIRAVLSPEQRALLERRLRGTAYVAESGAPRIPQRASSGPAPLSFAQQRLWFLDQLDPGNPAYHSPVVVRLRGALDLEAFRRAASDVVRRHESLRTTFEMGADGPIQIVQPFRDVPVEFSDFQHLASSDRERAVMAAVRVHATRPFQLREGALRIAVFRLAADDHVVSWIMHHIVFDGWSGRVLLREVSACYAARSRGLVPRQPPLPIQYADFAVWQRRQISGDYLEDLKRYWRQQLAEVPTRINLPTTRARAVDLSRAGARLPITIPPTVTAQLAELSRSENASLFMAGMAAFQVLLWRCSGQDQFLVGTPIANRTDEAVEGLIGFVVNTLAFRADLSGRPTFRELIRRTAAVAHAAYAHQDLPFEILVEELSPERNLAWGPLFQSVFALEHAPPRPSLGGLEITPLPVDDGSTAFDLMLLMSLDGTRGLTGQWEYRTDLFDADTIAGMSEALIALLSTAVKSPDTLISRLPIVSGAERTRLLALGGSSAVEYPALTLHRLVEITAAAMPDRVAVVAGDEAITYGELDEQAEIVADELALAGVRRGSRVAFHMEPSLEMAIAILAILKSDATCVPLDASYPQERLEYMVADCWVTHVLAQAATAGRFEGKRLLIVDRKRQRQRLRPRRPAAGPTDTCYILYTSGSTGRPKGILIPHQGLVNQMFWMREAFSLGPDDCGVQKGSVSFGPTICELFAPLSVGGRVVIASGSEQQDAKALVDLIVKHQVTILEIVPSLLSVVLREQHLPPDVALRHVFAAGETLPPMLCRLIAERLPHATLHNLYGPTEASSAVSVHTCGRDSDKAGRIPIGRPISNTSIYVVDEELEPVPVGVPGELCIASTALAHGYVGQPSATAERFVACPYRPGERMYRTGDIGRRLGDGALEYLGRADQQVKIGGVRIEVGEIESCIRRHPDITDVAVIVREGDSARNKHLVAYYVSATGLPIDLRTFTRGELPAAMVPSAFVPLPALPKNSHGKLDRMALQPPPTVAEPVRQLLTPTEEALAEILRRILGVPQVGPRENFFELGGHSLLAVEFIAEVRATLSVELPLRAVFECTTVAELAAATERAAGSAALPPIEIRPSCDRAPLSFQQEEAVRLTGATGATFVMPVRLRGPLHREWLERALRTVIDRHPPLRSAVLRASAASPGDAIEVERSSFALADSEGPVSEDVMQHLAAVADDMAAQPLAIEDGEIVRAKVLAIAPDDHALFVAVHRSAYDAHAHGLFVSEVKRAYEALAVGRAPEFPPLPASYHDFATWQRSWVGGPTGAELLATCRERLHGARLVRLPADRASGPSTSSHRGARVSELMAPDLPDRIEAFCVARRITQPMLLLAGYAGMLSEHTGQRDLTFSVPFANRDRAEIAPLIGRVVNAVPVRIGLTSARTFGELVGIARAALIDAQAFRDLPALAVYDALYPGEPYDQTPLFGAPVNVVSQFESLMDRFAIADLEAEPLLLTQDTAFADHAFYVERRSGRLELILIYRAALYTQRLMRQALQSTGQWIERIICAPDAELATLAVRE